MRAKREQSDFYGERSDFYGEKSEFFGEGSEFLRIANVVFDPKVVAKYTTSEASSTQSEVSYSSLDVFSRSCFDACKC